MFYIILQRDFSAKRRVNFVLQSFAARFFGEKTREFCFAKFCGAIFRQKDARVLFCKVLQCDFSAKRWIDFVLQSFAARFFGEETGEFCFAEFCGAIFR